MIVRLGFLLLSVLLLLAMTGCAQNPASTVTPTPTVSTPAPQATPTPISSPLSALPSIADVVAKVRPAVVYISVEYLDNSFFFQTLNTKTGSGVILSPNGYILTNNHVVSDARKIEVVLPDSDPTYEAKIVGTDPISDLAVIKINGNNFPAAEFGDPARLRIGDWVIALGNALGLEGGPTVTLGIVSNLGRSFNINESSYYDVIQTDAAINPGNSGGPLIDLAGKVVGINTFIISEAENIGFAVSSHTASRVYEDLVEHGRVVRPYLGVTLRTLTPDIASGLGLSINKGVLAAYVAADSPAAKAGIKVNDVITHFQDQQVAEASQLIKMLWEYKVGDNVKLTFRRGSSVQEVWATLTERP